jgi:hypothetical protein
MNAKMLSKYERGRNPMRQQFEARLTAKGPKGAWTFLPIPFDVEQVFGVKARVAVSGTMNGFPFRNSLMPEGDGTHSMAVSKDLQRGAKAAAGDLVQVVIEPDNAERVVEIPEELKNALAKHKQAASFFSSLTPSQKKEYADYISSAKQAATKEGRVDKALEMLVAGKKRLR